MKFKQLCESQHTIEDIYNILVKDCQQFKQLSKDFKNVPMRMLGGNSIMMNFLMKILS